MFSIKDKNVTGRRQVSEKSLIKYVRLYVLPLKNKQPVQIIWNYITCSPIYTHTHTHTVCLLVIQMAQSIELFSVRNVF